MYANTWTENTCDGFCSDAYYNPHVVDSAVCPLCDGVLRVHESAGYKGSGYWWGQAYNSMNYLKPKEVELSSVKNDLINTKPDTAKYLKLMKRRNTLILEVDKLNKEIRSFKRREAGALATEKLSASLRAQPSPTPTKELVKTQHTDIKSGRIK